MFCTSLIFLLAGALHSPTDREAFRRWFTFIAEAQYFTPPDQRPPEITDCSSLLRYAYREALRKHDGAWAAHTNLPLIPAVPSVRQYNYPRTPTGPRLFRITEGRYSEFADAESLLRFNVFFVTRNITQAQRGDLLFFHQPTGEYHTMIFIGPSQIKSSSNYFIVYDTGPDGSQTGQIKVLSVPELLSFPEPRWRPIPQNAAFLGVFRWNILKD